MSRRLSPSHRQPQNRDMADKVRGPSAPGGKDDAMPTKPDPTLDPANLPSRPNTTAVGNAGGLEDEGPPEKVQLPDMSQCDQAILTLDRQVQRLHQRHHLCMTSMAEDREEMKWIDAELKVFKQQYTELKERIARESTESAHAANVLEQSKAITLATRREQAKLLQETQQKIRALKIGSYRDTPKAIAFRSPHGILPKEIRPGNPSRNYAPAPFGAGNKPKPGTKSIYRKAGGLD